MRESFWEGWRFWCPGWRDGVWFYIDDPSWWIGAQPTLNLLPMHPLHRQEPYLMVPLIWREAQPTIAPGAPAVMVTGTADS